MALKNAFNICELICMMIGAIVGVGFITGAEIYESFLKNNNSIIVSILILFLLLFVLSYKILSDKYKLQKLPKMQNLSNIIQNNTIYRKNQIKKFLTFVCVVLISSAMFAGIKNLIILLFYNNKIIAFVLVSAVVFLILLKGVKGVAGFNVFAIVLLLFVIMVLSKNMTFNINEMLNVNRGSFGFKNITFSVLSVVLFVFMNIVEIKPIIDDYEIWISKKILWLIPFLFSAVIVFVVMMIALFLTQNNGLVVHSMPLMVYFKEKGHVLKSFYVVGLFVAIITTLLSCLIGVKRWFLDKNMSNFAASFIAVMICMVLSVFDFSFFVSYIYPIIGILNFIIFIFL